MAAPQAVYNDKGIKIGKGSTDKIQQVAKRLSQYLSQTNFKSKFRLDHCILTSDDGIIGFVIDGGQNEQFHNMDTRLGCLRFKLNGQIYKSLNDAGLNRKASIESVRFVTKWSNWIMAEISFTSAPWNATQAVTLHLKNDLDADIPDTSFDFGEFARGGTQHTLSKVISIAHDDIHPGSPIKLVGGITNEEGTTTVVDYPTYAAEEILYPLYDAIAYSGDLQGESFCYFMFKTHFDALQYVGYNESDSHGPDNVAIYCYTDELLNLDITHSNWVPDGEYNLGDGGIDNYKYKIVSGKVVSKSIIESVPMNLRFFYPEQDLNSGLIYLPHLRVWGTPRTGSRTYTVNRVGFYSSRSDGSLISEKRVDISVTLPSNESSAISDTPMRVNIPDGAMYMKITMYTSPDSVSANYFTTIERNESPGLE